MTDNKITVGAFVLGKDSLTLFTLPDAKPVTIPQGDRRVPNILAQITGPCAQGIPVEIELGEVEERNTYAAFNNNAGGGVTLVRIAKKFLNTLLGNCESRAEARAREEAEEMAKFAAEQAVLAMVRNQESNPERKEWTGELGAGLYKPKPVPLEETLRDIPTKPLDAPSGDDVLVAVTECGQVLPNAEKLLNQFAHVNKHGNPQGLVNLIKRLSHVIAKQRHSVEDVLTFVQKSDLSIADDGSIIAYKLLTRNGSDEVAKEYREDKDMAYDPYTRRVPQKVGTYVKVLEDLIDKSRANECSAGLHVCRIGYINSYTGELIYMVKVAPEDIVTVPHGDPNKVRVKGYHIVAKLTDTEFRQVKSGGFKEDSLKLLTAIIQGKHTPITHVTEITKPMGGGVIRNQVNENGEIVERVEVTEVIPAANIVEDIKSEERDVLNDRHKVDPKKVAASITPKSPLASKAAPTRADQAKALYDIVSSSKRKDAERRAAALNLQNLKRQAKVSWDKLGLTAHQVNELEEILSLTAPKTEEKAPAPKAEKPKEMNFASYKAIAKAQGADDNAASAIAYLKEGKLSKSEIARKCNTSTRTLGRWMERWG